VSNEKEHATDGPTLGHTRRGVILFSLGLGWGWAGLMYVVPAALPSLAVLAFFCSGFVTAAYIAPLYWIRGGTWNMTAGSVVLLVSSVHVLWMLMIGGVLFLLGLTFGLGEDSVMLLITGFGFAIVLGIASRSVVMLLAVVVAGVVAAWVAAIVPSPNGIEGLGTGIAVLHAAVVSVVAIETWHRPALPLWPDTDTCSSCGYSLVGLPEGVVCPECGDQPARGDDRSARGGDRSAPDGDRTARGEDRSARGGELPSRDD